MNDTIYRMEAIYAIGAAEINFTVTSNIDLSEQEEVIQQIVSNILEAQERALRDLSSAEPEIIRCGDCTHYHEDVWGDEIGHDDIPLILAHQMCDFWGRGCKTKEDAFCSFAERRTDEQKIH